MNVKDTSLRTRLTITRVSGGSTKTPLPKSIALAKPPPCRVASPSKHTHVAGLDDEPPREGWLADEPPARSPREGWLSEEPPRSPSPPREPPPPAVQDARPPEPPPPEPYWDRVAHN